MIYNTDMIKKMQQAQLDIYKDFELICNEAGVSFFVAYGSVIGAIRHKGFIPWDDDIDIGMLRDEYDKLIQYMLDNPDERYELLTPETQEGYVLSFGKFSKKGTEYIEAAHSYRSYIPGVAIDIFPFDETTINEKERNSQIKFAWIWNRIMVLAEYKVPTLPENMGSFTRKICLIVCGALHYLLRLFGITREKAYKNYIKYSRKYNDRKEGVYTDFSEPNCKKILLKKEDIFPAREVPFEDTTVLIMNNYDKALTQLYGTYMELPPEDQRHNHPPKYVDFGDGVKYGEK